MRPSGRSPDLEIGSSNLKPVAVALALALAAFAAQAFAALPQPVRRSFAEARVPLGSVAVVVQRVGDTQPLFSHQPDVPMNPASTMKLVTTFAALELLGPDFRWRTDAYLGGRLDSGTLKGDLVLKGGGDPKITIEQWQSLIADLRSRGLESIEGDLVLDRTLFRLPPQDPAAFDGEPMRPYNVGPDALLVNFKSVRLVFAPNAAGDAVDVRAEPALPFVALGRPPALAAGECGDWRRALDAAVINQERAAAVAFNGRYAKACGEREWNVALLDHPSYVHAMFAASFEAAGGRFGGAVRDGAAPPGERPFATLESQPLSEVVRDVNKFSNNVMARQVFLALGAAVSPPPLTLDAAREAVRRWLAARKLALPGLYLENGSGLSRNERLTARGLARLLVAADASAVREPFAASLPVAATDGTVARRFRKGDVAGQAMLKTGSLDTVRAIAGYVTAASGERLVVVAIVNDPNAPRAQRSLDDLVQWVYREADARDAKGR